VPPESTKRTVGVALAVSLVCSILVSATAVSLHERQEENRSGSTLRTILTDLDLIREGERIARAMERAEAQLVELATGEILPPEQYDETLNLEDFDIQFLSSHPEYGRDIPDGKDLARIKRMPKYMKVFTVRDELRHICRPHFLDEWFAFHNRQFLPSGSLLRHRTSRAFGVYSGMFGIFVILPL